MSRDFTIEGLVANTKMKMLVDSGAICSLINQKVIDSSSKNWEIKKSEYDKIVSVNLMSHKSMG